MTSSSPRKPDWAGWATIRPFFCRYRARVRTATPRQAGTAAKQRCILDPQVARRILTFLRDRVAVLDDPCSIGEALRGRGLGDFWKYRVGDWRIIADTDDGVMLITVIRLGNRRDVYRR